MSRQSYDEHLRQPGTPVSLADAGRWDWHRRTCPVCSVSKYSYEHCPEGIRLAKRMTQGGDGDVSIDEAVQRG